MVANSRVSRSKSIISENHILRRSTWRKWWVFLSQFFFYKRNFQKIPRSSSTVPFNIKYKTIYMQSNIDQFLVLIWPSYASSNGHFESLPPPRNTYTLGLTLLDSPRSVATAIQSTSHLPNLLMLRWFTARTSKLLFSNQTPYTGPLLYANGLSWLLFDRVSQIPLSGRYPSPNSTFFHSSVNSTIFGIHSSSQTQCQNEHSS